jgi:hypothetical protein
VRTLGKHATYQHFSLPKVSFSHKYFSSTLFLGLVICKGGKSMVNEQKSIQATGEGVSRRSFIMGSAAFGATAAFTTFTGCAPETGTSANEEVNANSSSEKKWEFMQAPPAIPDSDIAEVVETDILIIGAGPSGLATALSALDAGATDLIVLCKGSTFNALGGSLHAINSRTTKELGLNIDTDEISRRLRVEWKQNDNRSDQAKWVRAAYNSGEALDWLTSYTEPAGFKTVIELPPTDEEGVFNGPPGAHGFVNEEIKIAGVGVGAALTD